MAGQITATPPTFAQYFAPTISWAQVPALTDNYIYFIINHAAQSAVVVDPADHGATAAFLTANHLSLSAILITHHHHDHVGGVVGLQEQFACPLYAPAYDLGLGRIPHLATLPCHGLKGGDTIELWGEQEDERAGAAGLKGTILPLPGHTLGHIGYYFSADNNPALASPTDKERGRGWLFSADVIFSLGCGFLFEGDYETAFQSLQTINRLPPTTLLFIAHEYSAANLDFANWFWRGNGLTAPVSPPPILAGRLAEIKTKQARTQPTVPILLAVEQATNPFLQMATADEFRTLRLKKNNFSA